MAQSKHHISTTRILSDWESPQPVEERELGGSILNRVDEFVDAWLISHVLGDVSGLLVAHKHVLFGNLRAYAVDVRQVDWARKRGHELIPGLQFSPDARKQLAKNQGLCCALPLPQICKKSTLMTMTASKPMKSGLHGLLEHYCGSLTYACCSSFCCRASSMRFFSSS